MSLRGIEEDAVLSFVWQVILSEDSPPRHVNRPSFSLAFVAPFRQVGSLFDLVSTFEFTSTTVQVRFDLKSFICQTRLKYQYVN